MSRLCVATSFEVFPPRGGGQRRIYDLYGELARRGIEVEIVSLSPEYDGVLELAPNLRERRVARSREHLRAERALERASEDVPVTDIGLTLFHHLTPAYAEALAQASDGAAAVVVSHPFALPAVPAGVPVIYESHNVEADLKAAILPDGEAAAAARAVEAEACERAELVLACSTDDRTRLGELFGLPEEQALVLPNGVDPSRVAFTSPERRRELARRLGIGRQGIFVGSWHEPNLIACRDIIAAAASLPEIGFLLVGGAGLAFEREPLPGNVDVCGIVADGFLAGALAVSSFALNPMRSGSGTNMKMLDYMLAGLPVLSSKTGTRGLGLEPGEHYLPAEPEQLAAAIAGLREEELGDLVTRARERVLETFAWPALADRLLQDERMRALLEGVKA